MTTGCLLGKKDRKGGGGGRGGRARVSWRRNAGEKRGKDGLDERCGVKRRKEAEG